MAIAPQDIPLTRVQVQGWIDYYGKTDGLEDYLREQIDALNLPEVTMPGGPMSVADVVIGDLKAYVLPS